LICLLLLLLLLLLLPLLLGVPAAAAAAAVISHVCLADGWARDKSAYRQLQSASVLGTVRPRDVVDSVDFV
jgi:hypothetical protein